jgi:hypothetical protein
MTEEDIRSQVAWEIIKGNPNNISLDDLQTHDLNNPPEIAEYVKLFEDVKPANVDSITDDELDVIERATYHSIGLTTFDDLIKDDWYVLTSNVSKDLNEINEMLKEILKETDKKFKKLCEQREQLGTEFENRKSGFITYLRSIKESKEVRFEDPVHTKWLRERHIGRPPKHIKPKGAVIEYENNIPSFWVTNYWNGELTFTQEMFDKFVDDVNKYDASETDDKLYDKFKHVDGVVIDIKSSIVSMDNQIMHMVREFRRSIIENRHLQNLLNPKILIVKIINKNANTIELNAYKINGDAFIEWRYTSKVGGKEAQLQTFELSDKYFKLFECYSLKRIVSLKKTEDLVRELDDIKKGIKKGGTNKTPNTKRIKSNNRKYMSRSGRRVYRTRTNYRKKTVRQRRRR